MRVALVNPPFSRLVYGDEHTIKSITPCLGLFYLQAYCSDIADIEVFEGEFFSSMEELVQSVNRFAPDVLGVTTNTTTWQLCVQLANRIEAPIKIAGGPYAPYRIQECLTYFDAVCLGDGEISLRQLLQSKTLEDTAGIAWRHQMGEIRYNAPAPLLALDQFPHPQHAKMRLGLYQASPHRELSAPFATMVTTRGCGFQCTFCLSASGGLNGGKYRERSVTNVMAELEVLRRDYGVNSIQFWDDTFTMRRQRTREITDALRLFNISYVCNTRTDKIDSEIADMLASSGCKGVFFGVESGDQTILNTDHRKGVTNLDVIRAVNACKEAGIRTTTSFIFGSIDDTEQTIEETIKFSLSLDSDYVLYNIYTAHPGTSGYLRAIAERAIDHYTVDTDKWKGEPAGIPTICKRVSRETLLRLKAKAYYEYYSQRDPAQYGRLRDAYRSQIEQYSGA